MVTHIKAQNAGIVSTKMEYCKETVLRAKGMCMFTAMWHCLDLNAALSESLLSSELKDGSASQEVQQS